MKYSHRTLLGPAPCWKGFFRWGLCIPITAGSWYLYKSYPMGGLVAIGLTPFLCLFLFFYGLAQISRTIPYARTVIRAHRMGMSPVWGSSSGGFLLSDPHTGLWASDKAGGELQSITRIHLHSDGDAHQLKIFMTDDETPAAIIGVGSPALLEATAKRLQQDIACSSGHAEILSLQHPESL